MKEKLKKRYLGADLEASNAQRIDIVSKLFGLWIKCKITVDCKP